MDFDYAGGQFRSQAERFAVEEAGETLQLRGRSDFEIGNVMNNPPQDEQTPPSQSPWQISPDWIASAPIRKEYREERGNEMSALRDSHQIAEKGAIDFAQTVVRSCFVVNAGAIIAIPAIVALFNLDADALRSRLIETGLCFMIGICAAWAAGFCAFFTLAHKSDQFLTLATQTARVLEGKYFPHRAADMTKQAKKAESRARCLGRRWVIERLVAIFLSFVSVVLFLLGSWLGTEAVLQAPHKLGVGERTTQTVAPPKP